jgi:hypothetical protein
MTLLTQNFKLVVRIKNNSRIFEPALILLLAG